MHPTRPAPPLDPRPGPPVRVLLGDDHGRFRSGLVRRMVRHPRTEVVATAEDGRDVLEKIRATSPRVALVDLRLRALDGLEIASSVRDDPALEHVIVLLLTARRDPETLEAARLAGAAGCLDRTASRTALVHEALAIADRGGDRDPTDVQL